MATRLSCCLFLTLLIAPALNAKDKKKPSLPDLVLSARTVVVVIRPDAGEPLDQPGANATARENVEKALMEWGRLAPMMDGQETDLVIAVPDSGVPAAIGYSNVSGIPHDVGLIRTALQPGRSTRLVSTAVPLKPFR